MSVVTIVSATYCRGDEVARAVAERMGYRLLGDDLFEDASKRFGVPVKKLQRALYGPRSFFDALTREKARCVAFVRAAVAHALGEDGFVHHGLASHLVPRDISHVLRVCLVAPRPYRIHVAGEAGVAESEAAKSIERDDKAYADWTKRLFDLGPWDRRLYDIKVPVHETPLDDAVAMICENAGKDAVARTPTSRRVVEDFALAAAVDLRLVDRGYEVGVTAENGTVTLVINQYVVRLEPFQRTLEAIAKPVPGVKAVQSRVGPGFRPPSRFQFEAPPKILLVDDEREFVQTLSERLESRHIVSHVAYDGEEALSLVQQDVPEVMILDLRMPGIDGLEVLRRVKKDHPDVEVIILTGHGSEQDERLAMELGAFAYLQKPIDIEKLTRAMKEAYERVLSRRAEQEAALSEEGGLEDATE